MSASRVLTWQQHADGVQFRCVDSDTPLPFDAWAASALRAGKGLAPASLAPLLRCVDDGTASVEGDAVVVPGATLASFSAAELRGLGLPGPAPVTLRVEKSGLLPDRDFSVSASLVRPGGQAIVAPEIAGAMVQVGQEHYVLSEPLFSALQAIESLGRATSLEERSLWLARLQQSLPADALADDYLRFIHVALADSFTVLPRVDTAGQVDFDLRPARVEQGDGDAGTIRAAVPESREAEWNRQVRAGAEVRGTYALRDGHYLVLGSALREALRVAKRIQQGPPEQRAAFVRAPRAFLRGSLESALSDEAVEGLFWESGEYGARVRELDIWRPKVLPFMRQKGGEWLPTEDMGLRVGDLIVRLGVTELEPLLDRLKSAKAAGESSVQFGEQLIPATEEAIAAVEALRSAATPQQPEAAPQRPAADSPEAEPTRIAVVIGDNLESVDFTRVAEGRPGDVGSLPSTLKTNLYGFQREGLAWLQQLWVSGASGALLADDMGLGKTLQTLGFLAWVKALQAAGSVAKRPMLIVGPTGLLRNWQAEHDRHLGQGGLGHILEAHGKGLSGLKLSPTLANELKNGVTTLDVDRLASQDVVLTTYETFRDYQHSFAKVSWVVAVLDEAQRIKNPSALVTNAVKAVNASFTVALTGTPVENHLADLWCVTDAVQPGRLGALKDFVDYYVPGGQADAARVVELKELLTGHAPAPMLRRMKTEHLSGLPTIERHLVKSVMPDVQAEAYDQVVAAARGADKTFGMLKVLQQLRAVSLHPHQQFDGDHRSFVDASARLRDTIAILDAVASRGEKALVFVEALSMQGVLAELLQRRFGLSSPPLIVNGSVEGSRRKDRVDAFQARPGFDAMILSPRAAGVGLTIVEANHVVHLSRWWNPAVEDQATDRVYRIGQQRPVHVYTPLAIHPRLLDASFDVRLHELLTRKRELSHNVLAPASASASELASLYEQSTGRAVVPGPDFEDAGSDEIVY
jgi:hypothetical protein